VATKVHGLLELIYDALGHRDSLVDAANPVQENRELVPAQPRRAVP
jgi:hypothetical protein